MSKTMRKLISTEIWEPRGLEAYLTEMEAGGYRLTGASGWFLYFEPAEPQTVRYRAEYIRHPSDEQLALYADCGWTHVAETNREIQIFRAPVDADIPEIHTDTEVEANLYRRVNRRARTDFLLAAVLLALVIGAVGVFGLPALLQIEHAWRVVGVGVLTLLAVCGAVARYVSTRRYLRMLRSGRKTPAGSRRYRLGMYAQYGTMVFWALYTILLLAPLLTSLSALGRAL